MAGIRPLAGVMPAGHPMLDKILRARRSKKSAVRHLMDLIGALSAVASGVLEDPKFLDRSVLVDGITPRTSRNDLLEIFLMLYPLEAVVVRDIATGYRVGLVVFSDADYSARAINMEPRRGFYGYCIPASCCDDSSIDVLEALELRALRLATSELFRSLVPLQYSIEDQEMDLHLRCVFLRGAAGVSGGAYGLCRAARDELLATGSVRAVILHRAADAAVLVYDDAETTELLLRRAPRLLLRSRLGMIDSPPFPLPAQPFFSDLPPLQRQLPLFVMDASFNGRAVFLTGLDTESFDAEKIAYCIQNHFGSISEGNELEVVEAVIVHRSIKVVVVVLRSSKAVEMLLQEHSEVWKVAFGQNIAWTEALVEPCSRLLPVVKAHVNSSWIGSKTYSDIMDNILAEFKECSKEEIRRIACCLVVLYAIENPTVFQWQGISHRAIFVFASDYGTGWLDLCCRLLCFGDMCYYMIDDVKTGMALIVFKSCSGAERVLKLSPESWRRLGFTGCRTAQQLVNAGFMVEKVVSLLETSSSSSVISQLTPETTDSTWVHVPRRISILL